MFVETEDTQAPDLLVNFKELLPVEYDISGDLGGYLEYDEISESDVMMATFQTEVFRCATLLAPAPAPEFALAFDAHVGEPQEYIIEKPTLRRGSSRNMNPSFPYSYSFEESASRAASYDSNECASSSSSVNIVQSCGGVSVPDIPLYLMATHFEVEADVEVLSLGINEVLNSVGGVSYEFNHDNFEWNIYYLNGPHHCKAQVHIYAGFTNGYVVESNRLAGDSSLFHSLFAQLKTDLSVEEASRGVCYDSFTVFTPLPTPYELLESSTEFHGLGPIFRMARSEFAEAQLEASRTLCQLSNEENMRSQMVELGCVPVLIELLSNGQSEWVQQHALLALANLSDCCDCKQALLETGAALIPALLGLCCDGSYHTAEVRVLGAYVFAILCNHCVSVVASCIGRQALESFLTSVDGLVDERVRLHASRARDCLLVYVNK